MNREFDLALFGATGFTGQLLLAYLLQHAPTAQIVLVGRSQAKLEAVKASVAGASSLPTLLCDASDGEALQRMAQGAKVVVSTVGPYVQHGLPLVRACAEVGTHYADLTGEVAFIRQSIDACHERALQTGAALVHSCGFDSIPSDLGTLLLHEQLLARGHGGLVEATTHVQRLRGGISGGTAASMTAQLQAMRRSPEIRALIEDPYALDPVRGERPVREGDRDRFDAVRCPHTGRWLAPFVMAGVNRRVVRRSNALLGYPYGEGFRYAEHSSFAPSALGRVRAELLARGTRTVMRLGESERSAAWLEKMLPKAGAGPSEKARRAGGFEMVVRGVARDGAAGAVTVVGEQDPGYGETAKMLGESVLALLGSGPRKAGVSTPASALGTPMVAALRKRGMRWDVDVPAQT